MLQIGLLLFVLLLPVLVFAQNTSTITVPNVGLPGAPGADAGGLLRRIITGLLLPFAGVISILFLIIGGFQYMFAGSNEDLAKRGKNTIRNAVIGLVVVILSYVIVTVVVNTLFSRL